MSEPLYLLDTSYFAHASWHAAKAAAKDGRKAQPLQVVAGMVARLLEELQPAHLVACLDDDLTSWRRKLLPTYKAHRAARPEDLRAHFTEVEGLLNDAGLWLARARHCEADDVIATLTMRALGAGRSVVIVSADHDLDQLVEDRVTIWDPAQKSWRVPSTVLAHWGVPADKVLHVKALAGDSSDGIPGVPKVGAGIGARLVAHYGSVQQLKESLHTVHNLQGIGKQISANLVAHWAAVETGLQVARLEDDAPVTPTSIIERASNDALRIAPLDVAGAIRRIAAVPTPPPGEEPPHPGDLFAPARPHLETADRPGPVGAAAAAQLDLANADPEGEPLPPSRQSSPPAGWDHCPCGAFGPLEDGRCQRCVREQTAEPATPTGTQGRGRSDVGRDERPALALATNDAAPASPPASEDLPAAAVGPHEHIETIEIRERILAPATDGQGATEEPQAEDGRTAATGPDRPETAPPAPPPSADASPAEGERVRALTNYVLTGNEAAGAAPGVSDSPGNSAGQQPAASARHAPSLPDTRPAVTPDPGDAAGAASSAPTAGASTTPMRGIPTSTPVVGPHAGGGGLARLGRVDPLSEEQKARRRQGITASEIGALLQLGVEWGVLEGELEPTPWLTPMDVYLNKVQGIEADVSNVDAVRFGVLLEDDVLEMYLDGKEGAWVYRPPTLRSPRWPLAIATPDALVCLPLGNGRWSPARIVELKTSSGRWVRVPDYYVAQVHFQWAALEGQPGLPFAQLELDVDQADLPRIAAHWGFKYDPWDINLSEDWRDRLLYIAARFWREHVLPQRPPRLEARDRSSSMSRLYPVDTQPVAEASERARRIHQMLTGKYLPEKKSIEEAIAWLEAELQDEIGDAAGVKADGKELATWKASNEYDWAGAFSEYYATLDPEAQRGAIQTLLQHIAWGEAHKAIGLHRKAHRALVAKYTKPKAGGRRLLIKEKVQQQ